MALSASNGPAALTASKLMARGRESAVALEALLQGASTASNSNPAQQHQDVIDLAEQILCCLDRALAALHGEGVVERDAAATGGKKRSSPPGAGGAQPRPPKRRSRVIGAETPTRVERRSTPEDGFLWRKYGQKEIQNSKYQRTYFRCAYKLENGCKATRQVQQSEDDPSVYVVTYFGEHTCGMDAATTAVAKAEKLQPLVINFGSGAASSASPWLSSDCDVGISNSPQFSQAAVCLPSEEDGGDQKANVCDDIVDWCSVLLAPTPAEEPSSSADDLSFPSPDLDSLLHNLGWDDDYCGDSLFGCDMEFILEEAAALLR